MQYRRFLKQKASNTKEVLASARITRKPEFTYSSFTVTLKSGETIELQAPDDYEPFVPHPLSKYARMEPKGDKNHPAFWTWFQITRARYIRDCKIEIPKKCDTREAAIRKAEYIYNRIFEKWNWLIYAYNWKAPEPKKKKPKRSEQMRQLLSDNGFEISDDNAIEGYEGFTFLANGRVRYVDPDDKVEPYTISAHEFVSTYGNNSS